jgi:hypothetical protein
MHVYAFGIYLGPHMYVCIFAFTLAHMYVCIFAFTLVNKQFDNVAIILFDHCVRLLVL